MENTSALNLYTLLSKEEAAWDPLQFKNADGKEQLPKLSQIPPHLSLISGKLNVSLRHVR